MGYTPSVAASKQGEPWKFQPDFFEYEDGTHSGYLGSPVIHLVR
jgi:hypothetical protein